MVRRKKRDRQKAERDKDRCGGRRERNKWKHSEL